MKLVTLILAGILGVVIGASAGCSRSPDSKTGSTQTAASERPATPPRPLGTYRISEVHANGIITMISVDNSTEITFNEDGSYSRKSMLRGKQDHSDSGRYRIDGSDQLTLLISQDNDKPLATPVEKKHSFKLSADGDELSLTSADGKVAVFRRLNR